MDISLANLAAFFGIGLVLWLIWHQIGISQLAKEYALAHTKKEGTLLLDQSVVFKNLKIRASKKSMIMIERHYEFEFSTIGDIRYSGGLVMMGSKLTNISMSPHKPID